MRTRWMKIVALCLSVCGCGRPLPGFVVDPGEEVLPDAGQEVPCSPGTVPTNLSVGEGGRLVVPLSPTGSDVAVEVADLPSGWNAHVAASPLRLVVRAGYGLEGSFGMTLLARCGAKTGSQDLQVQVHKASWSTVALWTPSSSVPTARQMPTLWIDEANPNRMLMFGGHLYQPAQWTVTNDLWSLDLDNGQWSSVEPANAAPMQGSARVAAVPGGAGVLVHGGDAPDGSLPNQLWRFDSGATRTWTQVTSSSAAPTGRLMDGFVYDAARKRYLSAFGLTETELSDQVMVFTPNEQGGGAWQPLATADDHGERPSARYGFAYALDAETDRLIVFSGGQVGSAADPVNAAEDTWALELAETPARWVKLAATAVQPAGRRNSSFGFDPVGHRLIVWGGTDDAATVVTDVLALDLDRGNEFWHFLTVANPPEGRSSGAGVFDPKRNRALFGFGNSRTGIYTDVQALNL